MFDNLFDIVPVILSFVPRRAILSAVLVNKYWYKSVLIDADQESVACNNDMYSLLKIPYSVMVVINIAARRNHTNMISYLLKMHSGLSINRDLSRSMGVGRNEAFINPVHYTSDLMVGIYEGEHLDLADKFVANGIERFDIVKFAYKSENIAFHAKVENIYTGLINFDKAKIIGYCSRNNKEFVYNVINDLIQTGKFEEYLDEVCIGLIESNHYDIFKWLHNKVEHVKDFNCDSFEANESVKCLIRYNNYEFFKDIIMNTNDRFHGMNMSIITYCIHYRRTNMLKWLLSDTDAYVFRCKDLLHLATSLKFDDIVHIINEYKVSLGTEIMSNTNDLTHFV